MIQIVLKWNSKRENPFVQDMKLVVVEPEVLAKLFIDSIANAVPMQFPNSDWQDKETITRAYKPSVEEIAYRKILV